MHCFDFAPPICSPVSGSHAIKEAIPCEDSESLSESTCKLILGDGSQGSGVLIATRDDPFIIAGCSVFGLILTAGHVTGNILKDINKKDCSNQISVSFSYQSPYSELKAIILKEFAEWTASPQIDQITGHNYILPNDIALIGLIERITIGKKKAEIETSYRPGENAFIVGYPKKPASLEYCAPILKSESYMEKMDKIAQAFCDFNKRVKSDGIIMNNYESNLLSSTYSGTTGMSGAPIFNGNGNLIGINAGGATIKYQYEIGQVIGLGRENHWEEAKLLLNDIKNAIEHSGLFDYHKMAYDFIRMKVEIEWKMFDQLVICASAAMQNLAIHYNNPQELDHNVGISSTHTVFLEINHIVRKFENEASITFSSIADFYSFLVCH